MTELPEGWAALSIGEAFLVLGGGTPSTAEDSYWGEGYPWVTSADIEGVRDIRPTRFVTAKGVSKSTTNVVPARSILVVTRVGLGKIAIAPNDICFSQDVQALIQDPNIILPEFTLYFLSFELQKLKFEGRGTTISGITKKQLTDTGFPLPPLPEQHRIVAKIEELFSELDAGNASLTRARAQLKTYRQALLKAVFEGKLTAPWRAANPDKLESPETLLSRIRKERDARHAAALDDWQTALSQWRAGGEVGDRPSKPRRNPDPEPPTSHQIDHMLALPDTWQWVQIADFAFVTKLAGFEYTKHVQYDPNGDLPVLKAENAGPLGFRQTEYSLVRSESVAMLKRSFLEGGELLMVFVGAGTGNVGIVPNDQQYFLGPNIGMIRIEATGLLPRYLELFLRSPLGSELKLSSVKAVAQPSLSMETIRQIPVAIPSPHEQSEIIEVLDSQLEHVDRVEDEITSALTRITALRQSILKKAFSGQLVLQDPADEPASALLARLAQAPAPKPRRKTKP